MGAHKSDAIVGKNVGSLIADCSVKIITPLDFFSFNFNWVNIRVSVKTIDLSLCHHSIASEIELPRYSLVSRTSLIMRTCLLFLLPRRIYCLDELRFYVSN
jgi:hypothetical protein